MSQPLTPTSTIVQMLYAVPPRLRIGGLMEQLRRMVPGGRGMSARLAQVGTDTAHLDLPTGRLTLALHRDVSRAVGACLTVAVGPRPDIASQPDAAEQARLARKLTEAIGARFAPNQTLWHITPAVVSAALVQGLLATLPATLPERQPDADAVDMSRVLAQIERSLTGARLPAPVPLRRTAGVGFARRWPRDKGGMIVPSGQPAALARATLPMQPPANDQPDLPRRDAAGRLRTLAVLAGPRPRTGLTLTFGHSVQRMILNRRS